MKFLVLLLTALLSTHVSAIPTPRSVSHYPRRDENGTLLEMIAQYKQVKLKADKGGCLHSLIVRQGLELKPSYTAEQTKNKLLAEAQVKKLEIEKNIGFTNDSKIPTSTSGLTAKTASSLVAETYTILTATGPAIVFANQRTTRIVSLNVSSTVAASSSAPTSSVSESHNASTVSSPASVGSTLSSFSSVSSIVPSPCASSASACSSSPSTTVSPAMTSSLVSKTLSLSSTASSSAQPNTISTQTSSGSGPALQGSATVVAPSLTLTLPSTAAKVNDVSGGPVTVLTATGSAIVLASQGLTSTMTVNVVSPSQPTGSG